jgi:hypothetical protein
MTSNEISKARIFSQRIDSQEFKSPNKIVRWMGAIQAQDYSMAKWAIGVRLKNPTESEVESCIDKGEIIRTHLLRPTWHFVSPEDIYWMLQLSASKIKSSAKSRHKQLELTGSIIKKAELILEKSLLKEKSLSREEISKEFHKSKIRTDENRLSHIMLSAELDGIVCSGSLKKNKLTYSLLSERVPHKIELSREESITELTRRYFLSRFPATLNDFVWWSNLSVTEARAGMESVKTDFIIETIDSVKYWIPESYTNKILKKPSVHLLPAFDEFLISYKDRRSSLTLINNIKTISDNGIFHPPIVENGQVTGLWKRTILKNKVIIETNYFTPQDNSIRNLIEKNIRKYGQFLGKDPETRPGPE